VAFQITVSSGNEKIYDTIDKFYKHKLYNHFDKIYVFILKQKKDKYNIDRIKSKVGDKLEFDPTHHILAVSDLVSRISDHPLHKLEFYARIFKQQFSDIQIESRLKRYKEGYLSSLPEYVFGNLMPIDFPDKIYTADLKLDKEAILERWNEKIPPNRKPYTNIVQIQKAFSSELYHNKIYRKDWVINNNRIWSFSDLDHRNNQLKQFAEQGTIEELKVEEVLDNPDLLRVFKNLLKNSLIEDCSEIGLEFVRSINIIRFRLPKGFEGDLKITWKAKKTATKTVIKELRNKTEGHVICYRHLAFEPKFELLNGEWYLIIKPTWSFTNPGGRKTSRFQDKYLSGIKRMERNPQVYYFNLFWNYYLRKRDLFHQDEKLVNVKPVLKFSISPSLQDNKWLPVRENLESIEEEVLLEIDDELTPKLF